MPASHIVRPRRKSPRIDKFGRYVCTACVFLASLRLLIHFRGDISTLAGSPVHREASQPDLANGSILFYSFQGTICRERVIDNSTWKIRGNGLVNCAVAETQNANTWRQQAATQRATAIQNSFVDR
jgi:hypothetical protein